MAEEMRESTGIGTSKKAIPARSLDGANGRLHNLCYVFNDNVHISSSFFGRMC